MVGGPFLTCGDYRRSCCKHPAHGQIDPGWRHASVTARGVVIDARSDVLSSQHRGIHFCIGAPLSRVEGQVVFQTILHRLPNIHLLDPQPDWNLTKPNTRVLNTLRVAF
jgi:hypothetical protein